MRDRVLFLPLLLACADKAGDSSQTDDTNPSADPLLDRYTLPGDDAWPESVSFDPQTRAFFTSSLARGDVTRTTSTGESTVFDAGDPAVPWATVGLEIDAARRRLWTCASTFDGSGLAELRVNDLDSGERLDTLDLTAARTAASCTDVQLDADGLAYVTDRENPVLYRADLDAGTVSVWLEDPALEPGFVGLNGIGFTPDGDVLVSKYLPAELLLIPRQDPNSLVAVSLSGDPLAGGSGLSGADDLVFLDETLVLTMVDRLLTLQSTDGWRSATVTQTDVVLAGMTGLTVAEGAIYGSNGQAVEFSLGSTPVTPFEITRLMQP